MSENPVGRPTVITPLIKERLRNAFSYGATDEEACFYAGISKTAFYNFLQKEPEFAEEREGLKHRPVMLARETVVRAIRSEKDRLGDSGLAFQYLRSARGNEFAEVTRTDITTNGESINGDIDIDALAKEVSAKLKEKKT